MPRTTSWIFDTKTHMKIEHKVMFGIPLTPYERILKRKIDNEINMVLSLDRKINRK